MAASAGILGGGDDLRRALHLVARRPDRHGAHLRRVIALDAAIELEEDELPRLDAFRNPIGVADVVAVARHDVMRQAGILAAGLDAGIEDGSCDFRLGHAGANGLERGALLDLGDLAGPPQEADLRFRLDEAHAVDEQAGIDDRRVRESRSEGLRHGGGQEPASLLEADRLERTRRPYQAKRRLDEVVAFLPGRCLVEPGIFIDIAALQEAHEQLADRRSGRAAPSGRRSSRRSGSR